MTNDSEIDGNVNSTPDAAVTWIENKVKSHELSTNNGRLWTVAINALAALRRDDEQGTSEEMLELLPELERRWAIANGDARGDTGRTYASRARSGLKAHIRFLENPSGFRFESRPRVTTQPAVKKKTAKVEQEVETPAAAAPQVSDVVLESIPIPGKEDFRFVRPDNLSRADCMRVMLGLFLYCEDFDPMTWNPGSAGNSGGTGIVPAA